LRRATADVISVTVTCSSNLYSIGGKVEGLGGNRSVTLQDNGGDDLTLTSSGQFVFSQRLAHSVAYNVTILTASVGQICTVTNGMGTVAYANVSNVIVSCP
jgi:hypothetical protein